MNGALYPESELGVDDDQSVSTIEGEPRSVAADGVGKDAIGRLTDGQKACLRLVRENRTSKDIGRILELSPHTVDMRIRAAMRILATGSRAEAAREFAAYEAADSPVIDGTMVASAAQTSPDAVTGPQTSASNGSNEEWAWDQVKLPWGSLNTMSTIERVAWMAGLVTSSTVVFSLIVMILKSIKPAL